MKNSPKNCEKDKFYNKENEEGKSSLTNRDLQTLKHYFANYKDFCILLEAKNQSILAKKLYFDQKSENKILINMISNSDATSPILFLSSPHNNSINNIDSEKKSRDEAFKAHDLMRIGYENYYKGNYYKAGQSYKEALNIREKQSSISNNIADSYSNLGICCHKLGFIKDAIYCHKKALDMRMLINKSPYYNLKIANSYGNLGAAFLEVNDLNIATKYFANAVHIKKIINKDNLFSSDMLISYNQFGCLALAKGDYNFAKKFFKTALCINETLHPEDPYNLSMATILINVGELGLKTGNIEVAKQCFSTALKTLLKIHGDYFYHPNIAYIYGNLGAISLEQKEYEESLSYLNTALDMYKKSFAYNPYHIEIASSLYDISLGYLAEHNYLKSHEKLLIASPEISRKIIFLNNQLMNHVENIDLDRFHLRSCDNQINDNYQYDEDICFIPTSSVKLEWDQLLKVSKNIINQAILTAHSGIDNINIDLLSESGILGDNASDHDYL